MDPNPSVCFSGAQIEGCCSFQKYTCPPSLTKQLTWKTRRAFAIEDAPLWSQMAYSWLSFSGLNHWLEREIGKGNAMLSGNRKKRLTAEGSALAAYIPVRRAASVDPMVALGYANNGRGGLQPRVGETKRMWGA